MKTLSHPNHTPCTERPIITVPKRAGATMRAIVEDLNASANGIIRITADERNAARKIVTHANGAVFLTSAGYLKISAMWKA